MSEALPSVFNFDVIKHPYEAYQRLRDEAPVHFEEALNVHVVTRYDLVREAIRDTKTFSSCFGDFLQEGQKIVFASQPEEIQQQVMEPPSVYRRPAAPIFCGSRDFRCPAVPRPA